MVLVEKRQEDEFMQMQEIKWIFFDMGSTLMDETEAYNHRIREAISGTDITFEQFQEKRLEYAKQNLKSDIETLRGRENDENIFM